MLSNLDRIHNDSKKNYIGNSDLTDSKGEVLELKPSSSIVQDPGKVIVIIDSINERLLNTIQNSWITTEDKDREVWVYKSSLVNQINILPINDAISHVIQYLTYMDNSISGIKILEDLESQDILDITLPPVFFWRMLYNSQINLSNTARLDLLNEFFHETFWIMDEKILVELLSNIKNIWKIWSNGDDSMINALFSKSAKIFLNYSLQYTSSGKDTISLNKESWIFDDWIVTSNIFTNHEELFDGLSESTIMILNAISQVDHELYSELIKEMLNKVWYKYWVYVKSVHDFHSLLKETFLNKPKNVREDILLEIERKDNLRSDLNIKLITWTLNDWDEHEILDDETQYGFEDENENENENEGGSYLDSLDEENIGISDFNEDDEYEEDNNYLEEDEYDDKD
jgi:hypothetical protein